MSGQFVGAFDLSGFLAVPSSLKIQYQQAWNTYNSVQTLNSNVSTLRSAGDKTQQYYSFANYDDSTAFTIGQYLHVQRYPNSNWATVSKD
jgi:hypothetical protein